MGLEYLHLELPELCAQADPRAHIMGFRLKGLWFKVGSSASSGTNAIIGTIHETLSGADLGWDGTIWA